MATRTRAQREIDLTLVSEWYLQGFGARAITEKLNALRATNAPPYSLNERTLASDLQELLKRWRKSQMTNMGDAVFIDLQRLDRLEQEYWLRYESALKPRKTTRTKTRSVPAPKPGDKATPALNEAGVTTEDGRGWNLALAGVERCQAERRRILGIYAPEKVQGWIASGQAATGKAAVDGGADGSLDGLRRQISGFLDSVATREGEGAVVIEAESSGPPTPLVALEGMARTA